MVAVTDGAGRLDPGDDDLALPPFAVAIPAAGSGRRMGGRRKPYLLLGGEPLLLHSLQAFLAHARLLAAAVALPADDAADPPSWLTAEDPRILVVPGGASRQQSVHAALEALPGEAQVLAVHDGARPLVTPELVRACVLQAARGTGAVAGWPAADTIKRVDAEGRIVDTPDRSRLWHAQTPQAFPRGMILDAYRRASESGIRATDDAGLVERYGGEVRMVRSSSDNLKVTRPGDLARAELLLRIRREETEASEMR